MAIDNVCSHQCGKPVYNFSKVTLNIASFLKITTTALGCLELTFLLFSSPYVMNIIPKGLATLIISGGNIIPIVPMTIATGIICLVASIIIERSTLYYK